MSTVAMPKNEISALETVNVNTVPLEPVVTEMSAVRCAENTNRLMLPSSAMSKYVPPLTPWIVWPLTLDGNTMLEGRPVGAAISRSEPVLLICSVAVALMPMPPPAIEKSTPMLAYIAKLLVVM